MENEKLYRLMDVIDEIKQLDVLISKHHEHSLGDQTLLQLTQYKTKKEQLLTYFINEINALSEYRNDSLLIIKRMMERFYNNSEKALNNNLLIDKKLSILTEAISA